MSIAEKLVAIAENQQKVYEAGRERGQCDFWDGYQQNGEKVSYRYAFMYTGWTDETFKPKYDFHIADAYRMFKYTRIKKLAQDLRNCNVVFDTSNCENFDEMFQESKVTYLPTIDMRKAIYTKYTFRSCPNLVSIEKLIASSKTNYNSYCFNGCTNLVQVIFEGEIAKSGLNLQWSTKLDRDSIKSIINALSSTTNGLSITLSKTAVNTAFGIDVDDATTWGEGTEYYNLRHSKDNWTISYK